MSNSEQVNASQSGRPWRRLPAQQYALRGMASARAAAQPAPRTPRALTRINTPRRSVPILSRCNRAVVCTVIAALLLPGTRCRSRRL
jgi:hypothetical protein